jgi:hypothetical protein
MICLHTIFPTVPSLSSPHQKLSIVTRMPVVGQQLDERLATHMHAAIGSSFLGNGPVNTFPLKHLTTIGSQLLSNGAAN